MPKITEREGARFCTECKGLYNGKSVDPPNQCPWCYAKQEQEKYQQENSSCCTPVANPTDCNEKINLVGCPPTDRGIFLSLASGRPFYPEDPRVEDFTIEDIAHGLSNLCRYGGHCSDFYSVAQHSVLVSHHVHPENALWGLLHDASEGLGLVDLPRPVKALLPDYHRLEKKVMAVIAKKFSLTPSVPSEVKEVDEIVLATEKRDLMPPGLDWGPLPDPLPEEIVPYTPQEAEMEFLDRFYELVTERSLFNSLGDPRPPEPYTGYIGETPNPKTTLEKNTRSAESEDILFEAHRLVNGDRNNQYGPPTQDFDRTAKIWSALKGVEFQPYEVALFLASVKLSRLTWSPGKRDSWTDLAGYACCGWKCVGKP